MICGRKDGRSQLSRDLEEEDNRQKEGRSKGPEAARSWRVWAGQGADAH